MSIGTARDLTPQFIKLRNEAKKATLADPSLTTERATVALLSKALDGNSSSAIELTGPSWMKKSETIREEMVVLKGRLEKLKEAHNRALRVTFETENESSKEVDALTNEIRTVFRRLNMAIEAINSGGGKTEDQQVKLQVKKQLAGALLHLSTEFRREQGRYLNRMEQQKGLVEGSTLGAIEGETMAEADYDPGFMQIQMDQVETSDILIQERDEGIQKIVETISELAQIMRDLAILVQDQGTMLDRIDHNIVEVAAKVEEGVVQLKAAEKIQKTSRMMLCIIALVVIIVIMLIIVIIRHS